MTEPHPKSIRRALLLTLYQRYMAKPAEMLEPALFLALVGLVQNVHMRRYR